MVEWWVIEKRASLRFDVQTLEYNNVRRRKGEVRLRDQGRIQMEKVERDVSEEGPDRWCFLPGSDSLRERSLPLQMHSDCW